jgi:nitroreductase
MDFEHILNHRRSIRTFTEEKLTEKQLIELKEAILRVPSAKAVFPWRFYFITNEEKIEILSHLKPNGSAFIQKAPLIVVVTADTSLSDMWIEDCSIAATYLLLKAVDMGLGACWVQVRNRQHNDKISARRFVMQHLDIPESYGISCVIAIGHPDKESEPHDQSRHKLHYKIVDIQ